ncbi:MAG: hypothetical protein AAF362_13250 [Pseudomonadota bacterium]
MPGGRVEGGRSGLPGLPALGGLVLGGRPDGGRPGRVPGRVLGRWPADGLEGLVDGRDDGREGLTEGRDEGREEGRDARLFVALLGLEAPREGDARDPRGRAFRLPLKPPALPPLRASALSTETERVISLSTGIVKLNAATILATIMFFIAAMALISRRSSGDIG